jgi:low affinity Fe/Cu permease
VNTWQLVINTATSVLAFPLVALLQNSERRNDRATHEKVDRIACAPAVLLDARGDDDREPAQAARDLRESAGLQERM